MNDLDYSKNIEETQTKIVPVASKSMINSIVTDSSPLWWNWSQSFFTKAIWFRPNT